MRRHFGLGIATVVLVLPQVLADTKSGEVNLPEISNFEDVEKKSFKVTVGDKVKAECNYFINPDSFGEKHLAAGALVKNTSNKVMYYGYYVAFFDKDKNLVACTGISGKLSRLDPGKSMGVANAIVIPTDQLKKIVYYQVTLLEDEKEFGK